jgi:outer membrane protein W
MLLPAVVSAQLTPGTHHIMPAFGVQFATQNLLESTVPIDRCGFPSEIPCDHEAANPVQTQISLDPGLYTALRYEYDITRRLQIEGEFSFGISVLVIQMLELVPLEEQEQEGGEPQFETTTMDARILRLFLNLNYYVGPWSSVHPYLTFGVGGNLMDLRQKGAIKTDPLRNAAFQVGAGIRFRAHDRLDVRAEARTFMYNFHFDNQFASEDSDQIVGFRDVGLAVAAAEPEFQADIVVSVGFMARIF